MITKLLIAIEGEMQEAAKAAVVGVSSEVSMFEYGRKVGVYQGLEQMKALLENMLRDREAADKYL